MKINVLYNIHDRGVSSGEAKFSRISDPTWRVEKQSSAVIVPEHTSCQEEKYTTTLS
jgi:hypothetical protein